MKFQKIIYTLLMIISIDYGNTALGSNALETPYGEEIRVGQYAGKTMTPKRKWGMLAEADQQKLDASDDNTTSASSSSTEFDDRGPTPTQTKPLRFSPIPTNKFNPTRLQNAQDTIRYRTEEFKRKRENWFQGRTITTPRKPGSIIVLSIEEVREIHERNKQLLDEEKSKHKNKKSKETPIKLL